MDTAEDITAIAGCGDCWGSPESLALPWAVGTVTHTGRLKHRRDWERQQGLGMLVLGIPMLLISLVSQVYMNDLFNYFFP